MKDQTRQEPKIIAAAEKQMRASAFVEELADRTLKLEQERGRCPKLGEFITISREAGAGSVEIARRVGEKLGWEVLDKELANLVADRFHLDRSMLELVDEAQSNWVFDVLGDWLDPNIIPREKYLVRLAQIVLAAAKRGDVVFVGRGVSFLLPRDRGLAVRILAPEKFRIEGVMRREQLDEAKARRRVHELDRGRREFVRWFSGKDVADPQLYDMMLNVARLGPAVVADLIVEAHLQRRR